LAIISSNGTKLQGCSCYSIIEVGHLKPSMLGLETLKSTKNNSESKTEMD